MYLIGLIVFLLWFIASIPAALALLDDKGERMLGHGSA